MLRAWISAGIWAVVSYNTIRLRSSLDYIPAVAPIPVMHQHSIRVIPNGPTRGRACLLYRRLNLLGEDMAQRRLKFAGPASAFHLQSDGWRPHDCRRCLSL